MTRRARALAVLCAAALTVIGPAAVRAGAISQTQTLPLTPTDFGPNNAAVSQIDPLVFQKFNNQGGALALDSVTLKFGASIQNQFAMNFATAGTITDTVANASSIGPATQVPTTPGPTITLFQPNGKDSLLTVSEPNSAADLSRSVTYGSKASQTLPQTFTSALPATSPFYIAPTMTQQSSSLSITSPSTLALFTGTGSIALPVAASANSTIILGSGNGSGSVTTQGTASATITYNYHSVIPSPEAVPEPSAMLVWGIGGASLFMLGRWRRRSA